MSLSPSRSAVQPDPDMIDLTVLVRAHQAMYPALLALVQHPFDDAALGRVLQVRQTFIGDALRAQSRMAARA